MSLLEIRNLDAKLFYSKTGGWYADKRQKFSRRDLTAMGWLAVRKTPVSKSFGRSYEKQQILLSSVESVPNAAEIAWFVTIYFRVRKISLFPDCYVRTSSLDSHGDRVNVGRFGADGLFVDSYWDENPCPGVGLSYSRKFHFAD